MGTVRGGNVFCDKCGNDCTALYGFAMSVDRVAHTHSDKIKDIVKKVDDKYGQHDFIICWDCTIEMMGIPTKGQKHSAMMRSKKAEKKAEAETEMPPESIEETTAEFQEPVTSTSTKGAE